MFQTQNKKDNKQYLKSCCVLQDHYDDERNKTLFQNTTSDLQDQDQDQDRFFLSRAGLVRRSQTTSLACITGPCSWSTVVLGYEGQLRQSVNSDKTAEWTKTVTDSVCGGHHCLESTCSVEHADEFVWIFPCSILGGRARGLFIYMYIFIHRRLVGGVA